MAQNKLLTELSLSFKEIIFTESKFPTSTPVLDAKYKYSESYKNNNLYYSINNQVDYVLTHYSTNSKTTKCNINKFFTNFFIRPIIKNVSYCNADK